MCKSLYKCTGCGELKELSAFYLRKDRPIGRSSKCKICLKVNRIPQHVLNERRRLNPEPARLRDKKFRDKHIDAIREKDRIYAQHKRDENPEINREYARNWRKENKAKSAANTQKRRAYKINATPIWANDFFINEVFELARLRTRLFGFKWHVDHIVPLKSKKICGLHVENNLQVIPAIENHKKSNRYWPDMA